MGSGATAEFFLMCKNGNGSLEGFRMVVAGRRVERFSWWINRCVHRKRLP